MTRGRIKLHCEEFHRLYSSPISILLGYKVKNYYMGGECSTREIIGYMRTKFWSENLNIT